MIFLETQRGCNRISCPTKCAEYGQPTQQIPPNVVNGIINDFKIFDAEIHLYGFGEVGGYPFDDVNVKDTVVALTNQSYYLADSLIVAGACVFSRVDTVNDAMRVPCSTGYFTIATKNTQLLDIYQIIKDRPYAVKSLDSHVSGSKVLGKSMSEVMRDVGINPTKIYEYWAAPDQSNKCRIPIIRYDNGAIKYWPCVSDMQMIGRDYTSASAVYYSKCRSCNRYPKHKFIVYFEPS